MRLTFVGLKHTTARYGSAAKVSDLNSSYCRNSWQSFYCFCQYHHVTVMWCIIIVIKSDWGSHWYICHMFMYPKHASYTEKMNKVRKSALSGVLGASTVHYIVLHWLVVASYTVCTCFQMYVNALIKRAGIFAGQQSLGKCKTCLEKAAAISPTSIDILVHRARVSVLLDRDIELIRVKSGV